MTCKGLPAANMLNRQVTDEHFARVEPLPHSTPTFALFNSPMKRWSLSPRITPRVLDFALRSAYYMIVVTDPVAGALWRLRVRGSRWTRC
jgi:hypothetical protein